MKSNSGITLLKVENWVTFKISSFFPSLSQSWCNVTPTLSTTSRFPDVYWFAGKTLGYQARDLVLVFA